jgi:hypothetical protein
LIAVICRTACYGSVAVMRSRIIAAARLTALLLVLTLITGMSGYSCVGPAEFSSGLPAALSSPHDRRISHRCGETAAD